MNEHFIYSVLKYQYSQSLGEIVNIGLLVYFPNEWRFLYPKKLTRIRELYPDIEENHLKVYLRGFKKHSLKLSESIEKRINDNGIDFERFDISKFEEKIYQEFLVKDDSALQFSEPKTAVLYTSDIDKISKALYQKYLSPYDIADDKQKNNDVILRKLKKSLKEIHQDIYIKYFKNQDFKEVKNDKTSLKVDLHWKNGQTHLVQPLNFDLKKQTSIDNKANRYFGKLIQLKSEIEKSQLIIDIPLAKPSDKKLFKYYDKAIDILQDAPSTNLIEEEQLRDYAERTISELVLHEDS